MQYALTVKTTIKRMIKMKNKKFKIVLFILSIIIVYISSKLYIREIGETAYQMSVYDNPISALRMVLPTLVLGILLYKLGLLLQEKRENLGKVVKIWGAFISLPES